LGVVFSFSFVVGESPRGSSFTGLACPVVKLIKVQGKITSGEVKIRIADNESPSPWMCERHGFETAEEKKEHLI
jgi:hypothetical protein